MEPRAAPARLLGSGQVRVGTTVLGLNRRGWVAWPTTSVVTRLEPGRAVAWRTRESGATWTYELRPPPAARG